MVLPAAAVVAGVEERRTGGVHLGDEGVGVAVMCEVRADRDRKGRLIGIRNPSHVGVAGGIHGDAVANVIPAAAEVAGVEERRAGGVQLGDEGVGVAATVMREVRADRDREGRLTGIRIPGHVGVAGGIHGDAVALFVGAAAEVASVEERRAGGVHLGDEGVVAAVKREVRADRDREGRLIGFRIPGHVGVAGAVHGDAPGFVIRVPADVTAVEERSAGGVHLGDERFTTAVIREIRAHGDREVGRVRISGHVGIADAVHGDALANVPPTAADIAGVEERGAGGVHLGNEGVVGVAVVREARTAEDREGRPGGIGTSRYIGIAGVVHGDAAAFIISVAADVAGVDQGGIDSERVLGVVLGDLECDGALIDEREAGFDGGAVAVDLLPGDRRGLLDVPE